ncbi:MAG: bifunctional folylpolyglutamate synthase/dihydrofolate synthase [Planctomycetaceae bacterium]|nr:bifunctional folylpolyglutamate synthase/dihydrofolate synthase [Planctomycetaceae bacterium]
MPGPAKVRLIARRLACLFVALRRCNDGVAFDMVEPQSNPIATYDDATRWIYERIDYERIRPRRTSAHFRLERVERLLALIDSPEKRIPAVHIAGTKGKGSTSALLASILRASSLKTGLFTSPHIERFEERMRINGAMPTAEELVSLVSRLKVALESADPELMDAGVTYFEVATLLAWMFFDDNDVDVVVLETGLGGRFDCTTVCCPVLTIITNIGLDHTHILGDTLPKIAAEKAGIKKPGVPLLTWATQPDVLSVFAERGEALDVTAYRGGVEFDCSKVSQDPAQTSAAAINSFRTTNPWGTHERLDVPLHGEHQMRNAALATAAADFLREQREQWRSRWPRLSAMCGQISAATIGAGLASVQWQLRFQICPGPPPVILDAAHNPDSITALLQTFDEFTTPDQTRVLIFASSSDKDIETMLQLVMPDFDHVILTRFENNPRAVTAEELLQTVDRLQLACRTNNGPTTADSPLQALQRARDLAGESGIVCGTGSIFVAAELLQQLTESGAVA